MFKKISFLIFSAILFSIYAFSSVSNAEGDTICNGRIIGVTVTDNVNAGVTSFNAHNGPGAEDNELTNLSIVGKQSGLAPADRKYAACASADEGTYKGAAYKYALKGFAWNTNLGFVSFNCKNGFNIAGDSVGVPCGNVDYGVYVNDQKELFGHAWSPSFGWIQFKGSGEKNIEPVYNVNIGQTTQITLEDDASFKTKYFVEGIANNQGVSVTVKITADAVVLGQKTVSIGETTDFGPVIFTADWASLKSPQISFNLRDASVDPLTEPFDYGVTMAADGTLRGHAWTEAGVYMQMFGAKILLPDAAVEEEVVVDGGGAGVWCEGKAYVCAELLSNPVQLKFDGQNNNDFRIADGKDGYSLHLYLMDKDGVGPLGGAEEKTDEIKIFAGDATLVQFNGVEYEIYLVQTNPVNGALIQINGGSPVWIGPNEEGGVKYDLGDGNYINHLGASYDEAEGVNFFWIFNVATGGNSDLNVDSFLSTLKVKWSDTVKTDQISKQTVGTDLDELKSAWGDNKGAVTYKPLTFDDFSDVPGDPGHYVSKNIITSYAPTTDANFAWTTSTKPAYLVNNTSLFSKPSLIELEENKLVLKRIEYGALEDNDGNVVLNPGSIGVNGKADLPLKFRPAVEVNPLYVNLSQDTFVGYRGLAENVKVGAKVIGQLPSNITDDANITIKLAIENQDCPGLNCNFVFKFISNNNVEISELASVLKAAAVDLQVLVSLPNFDEENPAGFATSVKSPTLYTEVSYNVDADHVIKYRSNKIPRIPGGKVSSPSLVVHGSIQGQLTASVGAAGAVDTSGQVNVNLIRDMINENLKKHVNGNVGSSDPCTISKLIDINDYSTSCNGGTSVVFKVGNENVIYFKGSDVTLNLTGGTWQNEWVVVNDGGNIFIDGDIYKPNVAGARLSVVSLRASGDKYFNTGHVYIHPDVQNIQATIIADGSVFSYDGNHVSIDAENGEPSWATPFDRAEKLGKQLLIQGAIYSDNTIGGADFDKAPIGQGKKPKDYLLLGGGETVSVGSIENRLRAQAYDLNYLRMFSLDLEMGPGGFPKDQKCGKELSAEEIMALANEEMVCGEYSPCNVSNKCDGINPLKQYSQNATSASGPDGDLVIPTDLNVLAKELDNTKDFYPVYVYYVAPSNGSFLFSKAGVLNISGN